MVTPGEPRPLEQTYETNFGRIGRFEPLSATGALAADLSVAPLYKAPPAPAPGYNWSGFYAGVNGGGGWGQFVVERQLDRISACGRTGRRHRRLQLAAGNVVLGVEGDSTGRA